MDQPTQEFLNLPILAWIPALPLIGALLNLVLGRWFSKQTIHTIAIASVAGAFGISAYAVFGPLLGEFRAGAGGIGLYHTVYTWIQVGSFKAQLGFRLDTLSAVMILIVTFVGLLIHIYSTGYMAHDPRYGAFFGYLNLFTGSMLILVLAANMPVMFIGWEGVGLCSFLLIGFWYENDAFATAGRKAFVVNRIGDFAFLLGMFLLFWATKSVDVESIVRGTKAISAFDAEHLGAFRTIVADRGSLDFANLASSAMGPSYVQGFWAGDRLAAAAGILLFIGACGKSAQLPLFVWLPDAMAGPTPVSALIHAATMVTAGVYMVSRLHGLFSVSHDALLLVAGIGAATALFSALIGLTQLDIKKVMAYSTVSQLGYMFVGAGVGAFSLAIFHVVTHAFFKALLFLGSGSVIHGMSGEQDMRKMGGLRKLMPITFWTMLMGAAALAGVPFFAGWWSKDNIMAALLAKALAGDGGVYYLLYIMVSIGALCTAFYTFRMVMLTFFGENRASEDVKHHIHESPWTMTFPLIILAILSVVGGTLLHSKFVPEHEGFIPGGPGLYNLLAEHEALHHAHTINLIVTFLAAFVGILGAVMMYKNGKNIPDPE